MKKYISAGIIILLLTICFFFRTEIVNFIMKNVVQHITVAVPNTNAYKSNYSFKFVGTTENFHVNNRQDILNVIYTILNSGEKNFTFYCDKDYDGCTQDLKSITENQSLLSVINNMVSPFNSYKKLYVTTLNFQI